MDEYGNNGNRVMGWLFFLIVPLVVAGDYLLFGIESNVVFMLLIEFPMMAIGGWVLYVNRDKTRKRFLQQISPFNG